MSEYKEGTENTTSIKSYAAVAQKTKPKEMNDNPPQVMKIVPPLTKTILQSPEKLTEAYKQCASTILQKFPAGLKDQITISKTFIKVGERTRHSFTVVCPSAGKPYMDEIKSSGINLLGRTIFPLGTQLPNNSEFFPKKVKIKFNNLPYACSEDSLLSLLNLPEGVEALNESIRETDELPEGVFYTGNAILEVSVQNEKSLENFTEWSENARLTEHDWFGVAIYFHAPSVHDCQNCKAANKQWKGHDAKWCRFNKFIPPANPKPSNEPEPVAVSYEKQSEVVESGSLSDTDECLRIDEQGNNAHPCDEVQPDCVKSQPENGNNNSNKPILSPSVEALFISPRKHRSYKREPPPNDLFNFTPNQKFQHFPTLPVNLQLVQKYIPGKENKRQTNWKKTKAKRSKKQPNVFPDRDNPKYFL